jgi:hypothetical protein
MTDPVHPVQQRVGDALVGHAEGGAELAAEVERPLRLEARVAARQDVKSWRQDPDHPSAGALLYLLERLGQKRHRRPHDRVDARLEKDRQDVRDALPVMERGDELVLRRARVREAEEPVGADDHPRERDAAYRRSRKRIHVSSLARARAREVAREFQ